MKSQSRQRGLATMSAIILMAVVGAAVTTMTWQFRADAMRSKSMHAHAQIQQLLLAATAHVINFAESNPDAQLLEPSPIALPTTLANHQASAGFTMQLQESEMIITIQAHFQSITCKQTLKLTRKDNRWSLASLTMVHPQ